MLRSLRWVLLLAAALYGLILAVAFLAQRRLMYFPERYPEDRALGPAARLGLASWRDGSGALLGWRMPAAGTAGPRARVLVLHGNAGSALDRVHYASALAPLGIEVFLLEYPGYGPRPGAPTMRSLGGAAAEAVDQLAREGASPVWVLGESLGSGVAARAVALRPGRVKGLVLVTPFARMADVVRLHYPFLPGLLLRDRYAPEDELAAWGGPTWVLLAGRDEVVGVHQGLRLADRLAGPKRVEVQEEAAHNGLALGPGEPFWAELVAFLEAEAGR